jgi:AbrB family looped-hinge helix DNA binding protein
MQRQFREIYRAKVDPAGRVVIPAEVRDRLGIACGDQVILRAQHDGVRIETFRQALRRAQRYFAQLPKEEISVTDELIRNRREEASRE